jgi:hypothetical protein
MILYSCRTGALVARPGMAADSIHGEYERTVRLRASTVTITALAVGRGHTGLNGACR